MAPQLSTVHTGRVQHKIKEDALAELFASNSFSVADASKVALPESDDEMEDVAMNVALPESDEDEDLVDELEDLFVGEEKPKPKDYEDTAEFAMQTVWSEDLDEGSVEEDEDEDEESDEEDDIDDDDDVLGVVENDSQSEPS